MPMSKKLIKQMNEYYGCEYIVDGSSDKKKKKEKLSKLVKKINNENAPPGGWTPDDAVKKDKPEAGKVYALTGARGTRCIANGNTWAESEVQGEHAVTIDWGQEKQERKTYTFASQQELDAFMKGIEEADGWQRYEVV